MLTITNFAIHKRIVCKYITYKRSARSLVGVLFLFASISTFGATITASLDKHSVIENEVVQLTIRTDFADTGNGPDFSVLEKNFEILNQSQSSQFRFNLGTSQSLKFWIISLMPKSTGTFEIPPIKVGQYLSNPLTLEVKTSPALLDENGNPPIIIELEVSDIEPYLQQQVIVSLKLYNAFALQNANISKPKHVDLVMERLTDDQIHYETIKDTSYQVLTREYLAFPQKSGAIEIDPQTISAMVNTTRGRRLIKAQSNPIKLNVLPVPDNYPSDNWLPAKNVTITSTLRPANSRQAGGTQIRDAQVGDTLIWTITTVAEGAYPEQILPLEFISTRNYKLYPQPPEFSNSKSGEGIRGEQTITIEVVPTVPGTLSLPAIEVPYWDIKNRRVKQSYATSPTMEITGLAIIEEAPVNSNKSNVTALLKPQTRSVAPISLAKSAEEKSEPISTQKNDDGIQETPVDLIVEDTTPKWSLRYIVVAALLAITAITLITAILLKWYQSKTARLRSKNNAVPTLQELAPLKTENEKNAYKELIVVCENNQLHLLRNALVEWARHRWGEDNIRGLDDIKTLCESFKLSQLLMEAELIMYSDSASDDWDGSNLSEALEEFYHGEEKPSQASKLETLYPNF